MLTAIIVTVIVTVKSIIRLKDKVIGVKKLFYVFIQNYRYFLDSCLFDSETVFWENFPDNRGNYRNEVQRNIDIKVIYSASKRNIMAIMNYTDFLLNTSINFVI